jgi:hypothetical protein
MRIGGDAGTAIHTSVPFGIAGTMALAFHFGEDIDRRRVESHRRTKSGAGLLARRHIRRGTREEASPLATRVHVLIRETPATPAAK